MKRKEVGIVLSQVQLIEGIFDLWIQCDMAKEANAGQFICIYPKNKSTLLPRPISICEVDEKKESLRLVYRVEGSGTKEFSTYECGQTIDILGVLGNGFAVEKAEGKKVCLLGGGIGIPPMLELAKNIRGEKYILAGYRNKELFLDQELDKYGSLFIVTEDGSVGIKGNVLDGMKKENIQPDIIFACGPMPMLRAIKEYAQNANIEAYLSLEEHMACGVGACLGCVAKTIEKDHHSHVHNTRICTDGPVFEAKEVDI